MISTTCAIGLGFLLDLLFGDPEWMPHPIRLIGKTISVTETALRALLPATPKGERTGGFLLAFFVPALSFGVSYTILFFLGLWHPVARFLAESLMCYQIFAVKALRTESLRVYHALIQKDLPAARKAVSRIVGRDTQALTEEGVTKAAVETVAENAADGVIAPMFFLALGGAPLGFLYKAVNTMDSMVGYKNERYLQFGFAAAKLDDIATFLPARLAGLLFVAAAFLTGCDGKSAWKIFWRDRRQHKSPNAAHTEAACAGALGIQLAGNAYYFGKLYEKPTLGDALRPIAPRDILLSHKLLYAASILSLLLCLGVRLLLFGWIGSY